MPESIYESEHYCLNIEVRKKNTEAPFNALPDQSNDYISQANSTEPANQVSSACLVDFVLWQENAVPIVTDVAQEIIEVRN